MPADRELSGLNAPDWGRVAAGDGVDREMVLGINSYEKLAVGRKLGAARPLGSDGLGRAAIECENPGTDGAPGLTAAEDNAVAVGEPGAGEVRHRIVCQNFWLALPGGEKDELRSGIRFRPEGGDGENTFAVGRDGTGVAFAELDGRRAIGFTEIDLVVPAGGFAFDGHEDGAAIGGKIVAPRKIEPGKVAGNAGKAAQDFKAHEVAGDKQAMVARDIVNGDVGGFVDDFADVSVELQAIDGARALAAGIDLVAGEPNRIGGGIPGEAVEADPRTGEISAVAGEVNHGDRAGVISFEGMIHKGDQVVAGGNTNIAEPAPTGGFV